MRKPCAAALVLMMAVSASAATSAPVRVAILNFSAPDSADMKAGEKVAILLTAELATKPGLTLVERKELEPVLKELALSGSGVVRPDQVTKIGELFGAQALVTGQMQLVGDDIVLAAKIIVVRTGQVFGAVTVGAPHDKLTDLVGKLAVEVADTMTKHVVPALEKSGGAGAQQSQLAAKLKGKRKPVVAVCVDEFHLGDRARRDPAAQTRLTFILRQAGFTVMDTDEPGLAAWARDRGNSNSFAGADVVILGEAVSERARTTGDLATCQARVELRFVERATSKILAIDQANATAADVGDLVSAKKAIAAAVDKIAEGFLLKGVAAWEASAARTEHSKAPADAPAEAKAKNAK